MLTAAAVLAFGSFAALCFWLLMARSTTSIRGPGNLRSGVPVGRIRGNRIRLCWPIPLSVNTSSRRTAVAHGRFSPLTEGAREGPGHRYRAAAGQYPAPHRPGWIGCRVLRRPGFRNCREHRAALNNAIASYPPGQRDNLGSLAVDVTHEVLRNSWTGHIVLTGIAGFGIGYLLTTRIGQRLIAGRSRWDW